MLAGGTSAHQNTNWKSGLALKVGHSMDRFMSTYACFVMQPWDKYTVALVMSQLKAPRTRLAVVALFSLETQAYARDAPVARAAQMLYLLFAGNLQQE